MRCTFSGRLAAKQSNKCLLISNDGENGPSAPARASMQRFRMALATSPATLISPDLSQPLVTEQLHPLTDINVLHQHGHCRQAAC